jgi:hypothetical protein
MTIVVTPIPSTIDLAAPSFTLTTANAAGDASTAIASDSDLLLFDATLPDAITYSQSGSTGVAAVASRRDHAHAMAAGIAAADDAQMEAASSTTVFATPGRTQFHPGVAKAWCHIAADGTLESPSYNVASITYVAAGNRTIVWTEPFSTSVYAAVDAINYSGASHPRGEYRTFAVGSVKYFTIVADVDTDFSSLNVAFGDQ